MPSGSIPFPGTLTGTSESDIFPTHIDEWGKGGYRSVDTIVDRNNITESRREDGMLVYVRDDDITYQLKGGITNAHWEIYSAGGDLTLERRYVTINKQAIPFTQDDNIIELDETHFNSNSSFDVEMNGASVTFYKDVGITKLSAIGIDKRLYIFEFNQSARTITVTSEVISTGDGTGGGGVSSWNDLTDKPSEFKPEDHEHEIEDIKTLDSKLTGKQNTLVSGINIKTVNGETLLGIGNIARSNAWYGVITSASMITQNKVAQVSGFEAGHRITGTIVVLRVPADNFSGLSSLNVQNTGAAEVRWNGQAINGNLLNIGDHIFQWDGQFWNWLNYPQLRDSHWETVFPRSNGIIQNRSLAAATVTLMTPVPNIATNMISGNRFVAPVRGVYTLSIGGGWFNTPLSFGSLGFFEIKLNSESLALSTVNSLSSSVMSEGGAVVGVSATHVLHAGEYFSYFMYSSVAQPGFNSDGSTHKYTFARIA
jgi:hypothetical protein